MFEIDHKARRLSDEEKLQYKKEGYVTGLTVFSENAVKGTNYKADIRPFFYGNEYYMIVSKTYKDVRLVGAPPSSLGKFGGDTDNWVWPRHTCDFSVFRIYADENNEPAEISDKNMIHFYLLIFAIHH